MSQKCQLSPETSQSSRSRSRPERSLPDQAYLAIATLDDLRRAWRSSLYGFAATCPSGTRFRRLLAGGRPT